MISAWLRRPGHDSPPGNEAENAATRTIDITNEGTTVGTIAYMSPEQARGIGKLTPQSDQFSFRLVLPELCAGKRAFVHASAAEIMTAIIRDDASSRSLRPSRHLLRWVIDRLLAKDPVDRYDTTRDLYRELRHIRERYTTTSSAQQIAATEAAPAARPHKPRRIWVMGGAALGLPRARSLADAAPSS